MNYKGIDQKALQISKEFRKYEVELLEIISKVDQYKVFRKMGYPSLFQYVVSRLKLSEAQAYAFITVARKSKEVPQLKESIQSGQLTVSKAKRITSVINSKNQDHWLKLAQTATQKKVEREVSLANPKAAIIEKMNYTNPLMDSKETVQVKRVVPRVKLEVGLSEKLMLKIRRVQDLISQKQKSVATLEETLESVMNEYISRHDPVEKAKRQKIKGKLQIIEKTSKMSAATPTPTPTPTPTSTSTSTDEASIILKENGVHSEQIQKQDFHLPTTNKALTKCKSKKIKNVAQKSRPEGMKRGALPAKLKHQVYLQSNGQCSAKERNGARCKAKRFLEVHHIHPVSEGGRDTLDNLTLLCAGHHKLVHEKSQSLRRENELENENLNP